MLVIARRSGLLALMVASLLVSLISGCSSVSKPAPIKKVGSIIDPSPAIFLNQIAIPHVRHSSGKESQQRVSKGDTLYGIAWRYDLDPQILAAWNHIKNPNLIPRNKILRLTEPTSLKHSSKRFRSKVKKREDSKIVWAHPYEKSRVADRQIPFGKSVRYAGIFGDPVRAAADGLVVYSGSGLKAYGELIIVKHDSETLSAYGHNSERLVLEGDYVTGGQQISRMGKTAAGQIQLHFEIRVRGKPVEPGNYLPGI